MYVCTKCGKTKSVEEYSKILNRKKVRVRSRQCKTCVSEYKRSHYQNNRDKYLEKSQKQYRENVGYWSDYNKRYQKENKDRIAEQYREYTSQTHVKEAINDRFKEYRKDAEYLRREKSRGVLNKRIQSGKITKPDNCTVCGSEGYVEAHHEDYDKPLDVKWVCKQCHEDIHHSNEGQGA